MIDLTPRQGLLADEFLGNFAEAGSLTATLEEIIKGANQLLEEHAAESEVELTVQHYTLADAEEMLKIVQTLDPAGVGARDLRECLLLPLEAQKRSDTLAYRLVKEAWEDLKAHRWSDIGKRYGLSPEEVQRAADDIAKLDPKPGLQYSAASDVYIIPDLVVQKIDDKYHVFLNDSGLPRLRISKTYQDIARDKKQYQGENKEFINQRLNSAHWMIQAIEQRRQTMLKVMNFIVDRQREFFEKGIEYLKPLTLREVADVINMHESTVSRVTNEKYVQTPRGLLPLKFFFSSGLSTTTGEDASARAIRAQIQKMVADEDSKNPLTDQQIVEMFAQKGVKIARRTVAKYRSQRGIADALASGADAARGRVLVFYPADLQYRPSDIPGLVQPILDDAADVVTGTKQGHYEKRFVSWVYNGLCRWLFGVRVTDLNSVKAYRREVLDGLTRRPDWHRFMVVIAAAQGFRLAERPVPLQPRRAGKSKFGIGRIPVGVLDLVSVWFQLRFGRKPMLFFGVSGAVLIFLGFLVGVYALFERYALHQGNRAFLYLVLLLVLAGLILFGFGFVGEMLAGMREEVRGLQREMDQLRLRTLDDSPPPSVGRGST